MSRMLRVRGTGGRRTQLPELAAAVTVIGYAAAVVALALSVQARAWDAVMAVLLPLAWLVAASLAVRARPDHPGAFLFVCLGAGHLVGFALDLPVALDSGLNGWGAWALNLAGLSSYGLGFAALGAFLATYPSGVPHSGFERWFVRGAFVFAGAAAALATLTEARVPLVTDTVRATMPAPAGLPRADVHVGLEGLVPVLVVVGAGTLVVRGRRSTGEERRQLTWAVGAAGLLALMLASSPVVSRLASGATAALLFVVVVSLIPFVLLAGLVRYRLMDVDLYVTRTLASGAVVVIVLAAYATVAGVTAGDRVATAALVVVAALTGAPLVRLLSRLADRWFSGGRVRGQALLRELARSMSSGSSPEDIATRTVGTIADSLDVAWVRLVAGEVAVRAGAAVDAGPVLTVPLATGEHEVGRLECGPRHGGWSTTEVDEVELLARHAALALHNADLSARLAAQVEELQASRLRIVRAELNVRRQLQRDLHDGIQQQVVALIAHLGALRVMVPPGSRSATVLGTAHEQAGRCLADLRDVVHGVSPPVLADRGVVEAVESRAALLPLPVQVDADGATGRWPPEIEAAAYYVASEALTNVVKHSRATRATVRFGLVGGDELEVCVSDDGRGLPAGVSLRGLAGLRDRVEALGGAFDVRSGGCGTTVTARLPAGRVPEPMTGGGVQ